MLTMRTIAAAVTAALLAGSLALGPGAAYADDPTLTDVTVTADSAIVAVALTDQFHAVGHYSDGTSQDITAAVTWSSSNPSDVSVDATGLGTAVAPGSAAITATVGAVSGFTTIAVSAPSLTSISVTPMLPTISKGTTVQFTATGTYSDSTTLDLTSAVTWTSQQQSVATISNLGLATGVGPGAASIAASFRGIVGSASLTVSPATLLSIAVTPVTRTIATGTTVTFTATGTFSDGSTADLSSFVTWHSSAPSVAQISISGTASGISTGTTTITASSRGLTGSATLTVTAALLLSISVVPTSSLIAAGRTAPCSAIGTFSDGTQQDLTTTVLWTSSNSAAATVQSGSFGAGGLVTAVAPGSAQITASLDGVSGSAWVSVTAATLVAIAVTPASSQLSVGGSEQLFAFGTFSDGSTEDLTSSVSWGSSRPNVASVNSNGVARTTSPGDATAIATDLATGVTGAAAIVVRPATLFSLHVTPTIVSLPTGNTQQFVATGTYSDATTKDLSSTVTWTSSTPSVAAVSVAGAATAVGVGTTTITAQYNGVISSAQLTVTGVQLTSIVVSPVNRKVAVGGTARFTAIGHYSDGTTQDLTATSSWTSSTPAVATVDAAGVATAVGAGSTTVSATASGVTGTAVLTVTGVKLVSIAVAPAKSSVAAGATKQFTATGRYSDGTRQDVTASVTWASSTPVVATIAASGLASTLTAGTSTITATLGTIVGSATLTVTAPKLLSITVSPPKRTFAPGTAKAYSAIARYSDGTRVDVTSQVVWTSSTPAVATVDSGGVVAAIATGTSTITATLGSVSGSTTVTVGQ